MEFDFVVKGRKYHATRERVIEALRDVPPGPPSHYMVVVEGTAYPVRQALVETFAPAPRAFSSEGAVHILTRLGFEVCDRGPVPPGTPRAKRIVKRPVRPVDTRDQPPLQSLEIGAIELQWSHAERWDDVANPPGPDRAFDAPPGRPGVYEVGRRGEVRSLYIGKAAHLQLRITEALIRGTTLHGGGEKIRENENPADLTVRWAATDRPAAAEEELHRQHQEMFGCLPLYVSHT